MRRKGKASNTATKKKSKDNRIDIDKLDLKSLRDTKTILHAAAETCSSRMCKDCISDRHNFAGRAQAMDCSDIRRAVDKLIADLEAKGEQTPVPSPEAEPEAELPEPPYDIDKLSFPQLLTLAKRVNEVQISKCPSGGCAKCISDKHNYTGDLSEDSCVQILSKVVNLIINRLIENRDKIEKAMSGKKSSGKQEELKLPKCACSDCKWLDGKMTDKGYHFCLHWHNFTVENGYCHAYEESKSSVETCG